MVTIKKEGYSDYLIRIGGFSLSLFLFYFGEHLLGFGFQQIHYLIFIFIIFTGILLSAIYYFSEYYDKVLHFLNPFLLCFIIFFLMDKINTLISVKIALTVAISIACLSIMETGEYLIDRLLGWNLQGVYLRDRLKTKILQSKHDDAMQDILFGIAGCLLFVLVKLMFKN